MGQSQASGHSHSHAPANFNKAFIAGIVLNTAFVVIEAAYGFFSHSLALVADAGHNLSDVLSLVMAWIASSLVKKSPTAKRTYGYRRSSILAALFNAVLLLIAIGAIAWEAIRRFANPETVTGSTVIWVAAVGIVINSITALFFMKGSKGDINIKGAYLHMAADAAVSFGVVMAGIIMLWTHWPWLDSAISLIIVVVIFLSTWGLLKESINLALDAVPKDIDYAAVKSYFEGKTYVSSVHDLHIWGMSTTEAALTVHLVVQPGANPDDLIKSSVDDLHDKFHIEHATIQIESEELACLLTPEHTV